MKLIMELRGWGIFSNSAIEVNEHGFDFTVLRPNKMCNYCECSPSDSEIQLGSLEQAVIWVKRNLSYEK